MKLPDELQQRPFAEWNHLVKGIVEVWELARLLGLERALEEHLSRDDGGHLAELLGWLGCERAASASALRVRAQGGGAPGTIRLSPFGDPAVPDNTNHVSLTQALLKYCRAAHNGHCPDDVAYQGGQLVREFLLWMEKFGEVFGLDADGLALLAREALGIYAGLDVGAC